MQRFLLGLLLPIFMMASAHANVFVLTKPPAAAAQTPVVTPSGNIPTFTQVGTSGPAVPADSTIGLTCACSGASAITGATIQITGGSFTNDALNFATIGPISGVFSGTTMTLSGSDTVAHYQTALQSVTYSSTNADPTNAGANPTRTISWIATSAAGSSNTGTSTLNVALSQVAPVLSGGGNTVTFTSPSPPVTIDSGIGVASSVNVTGATVSITSGLLGTDSLNFANQFSITGNYSTGVLILSGSDTAAHYQTALASVTYSSSATDPTNAGADVTRTVTWQGSNGPNLSNTVTSTVNVQNPAQPSLSPPGNNVTVNYTSGGGPLVLDSGMVLTCTCATLTSATISIGAGFFPPGDTLAATVGATSISQAYNATTGILTLTGTGAGGTDTKANFQTVLRTVAYSSSAGDPTNTGSNPTRTINWVANNSTVSSSSVSTFVDVFTSGQPSWVLNGATVAFNPGTQQCWIVGVGTGPLNTCLQETRATQETCINGATVTYAAPNVICATTAGMQVLPAYTNFVTFSNDQGNTSGWIRFASGSGTVTATSNSVVAPDGTTTAAAVTIQRTSISSFGDSAIPLNNHFGFAAGTNSFGIWLKLDPTDSNYATCAATPSTCAKKIDLYVLAGPNGAQVATVTLTAVWTEAVIDNFVMASACPNSGNCQFGAGFTGASSNNQTGTVVYDSWGAEINAGPEAFPTLPTTTIAANSAADNIIGLSQINTAMTGAASSIISSVSNAQAATVAEVVDSNGSALLEETVGNNLTTLVGPQNTTTTTGVWTGSVVVGYAHNATGRTFALNNGVIVKDASSVSIATPITFGSSNTGANPLSGNIGITNMFSTRVADNVIGAVGSGTKYYFANNGTCTAISAGTNGSCNDSNPCTITLPCNSVTKANALTIVTNDQMNFNGGDTFTGCLLFTGNGNWNATRTNPAIIQSYGTGQATLTPNCTGGAQPGSPHRGIISLISTDGVTISNLNFVGDGTGNGNDVGIYWSNCDVSGAGGTAHGTILVQGNNFSNIVSSVATLGSSVPGAAFFNDPSCNNFGFIHQGVNRNFNGPMDHISIINNTDHGATLTSPDTSFMSGFGTSCSVNYDAIQGNLIFNLGGQNTSGSQNFDASGILIAGACGAGSVQFDSLGPTHSPSGLTSANVQFNVVHHLQGNIINKCGSTYAIWTSDTDSVVIRENETYEIAKNPSSTTGCDSGDYDLDSGGGQIVSNSLLERNYGHHSWGPCIAFYAPVDTTARWNVCDSSAYGPSMSVIAGVGSAREWIYNNTVVQSAVGSTNTGTNVNFNGCPLAGSILANNIIVNQYATTGQDNGFRISTLNSGGSCTLGSGGLTIANNDWWSTRSSFQLWAFNGGSSSAQLPGGATFANFESYIGETGGQSVNPQLFSAIGGNLTCNSTAGSPGPQASGCPSGYTLGSSSPMAAPAGATLTSALPNGVSLPTTIGGVANKYNGQGTLSYYGDTLPCTNTVNGGYPIGADCGSGGVAPPPSFSLDFTTGSLPSCSGCSVTFTGGANASYYTSANVLHAANAANNPRLDHNPANGATLGILIEPALTNTWPRSEMASSNTNTADNDHATLGTGGDGYYGVWGAAAAQNKTGPDNVANSAGTLTEDFCAILTSGTPATGSQSPCTQPANSNAGDGGHTSLNNYLTSSSLSGTATVSSYVKLNNDAGDAHRNLTFYAIGAGACFLDVNLATATQLNAQRSQGGWTCTNPIIQSVNIAGNAWLRVSQQEGITSISPGRINWSACIGDPTVCGGYTADGHSGFQVYGGTVVLLPHPVCLPQVSGAVPCSSNSYIRNAGVGPTSTTADILTFNVPAGLCALTYTFDDNTTQKQTIGGSCATTITTGFQVPLNLNRPWIKTIVGSVS